MKHSTYITLPPWVDPSTFLWEHPYAWDAKGNIVRVEKKPAFIKAYPVQPPLHGVVVCVRIMGFDPQNQ